MDKLMPAFYAGMDIQPGSIHDEIIKDKMRDDTISKIVGGILLAVVAVALTVVSLGTATPAVVAAGASIGAAGLSTYMAYEEYKDYTARHAVAEAGFAEDPSMIWLVLAIVGAGVDMAATVRAVRALAPAAHALESPGGSLANFQKAVQELATAKQLEQKTAEAAERAASARAAYKAAKGELGQALGKAYSLPGPLTDPEVYRSLVKMAIAKIRQGGHSLSVFVAELRQARIEAKLAAELSPEELSKVKQAWAEAEVRIAIEALPEEQAEKLLYRISRGDAKGRAFGTPRNPNPPSLDDFNPRVREIRAGNVEREIKQTKHGLSPEQEVSVRRLSNEDLIRFRIEDPISAAHLPDGGLSLTGGHHRAAEIVRRVAAGQLPPNTPVPFLLHD
jgi:hypothetical protein